MSILLDAASNSGAKAAVSSFTWSHTVAGTERLLVVGVGSRDATAGDITVNSVTYNGVALTKLRHDLLTTDQSFRSELWYLVAPDTGAHDIVVTLNGTATATAGTARSLTGVHQTSPIDAQGGATGITLALSAGVTVVAANSWLLDVLYSRSTTLTVNGAQTEDVNLAVNSNDVVASSRKLNVSAGARTMDWTESNDGNDWAMSVVSVAPALVPTVTTSAASSIADNSATGNGNVTDDGGDTITERGFVWSTSANPTTSDNKVTVAGTTGGYSGSMTGLTGGTLYHYRAYAINTIGTSYGADTTFTTTGSGGAPVAPTVSTDSVDTVSVTSANANGNVTDDGDDTITERGFVVSTMPNPTILDTKFIVSGTTGSFSSALTALISNTQYYVRAYATNGVGTSYGSQLSFTTSASINIHKHFIYRVYTANVYVDTWTEEVLSEPVFKSAINFGYGELTVRLGRPFDEFGEDVDIKLNNKVEIYVVDKQYPNGNLLYVGYIAGYRPVINREEEYVEITLFSYEAELQRIMLRDVSGNTTVAYSSYDPSNILKSAIDEYRRQGGTLRYTSDSIDLTNTVVTYTFNTNTIKEVADKVIELCPAGWYYRIEPDGIIYLKPKHDTADHTFTIGLNVEKLETYRRIEDLVNRVLFTGGGDPPLYRKYENTGSQDAYGLYEKKIVDERVTVAATASTMATREINNKKDPEIRSIIEIVDNNGANSWGYDIESVKVGETLSIKNLRTNAVTASKWDVSQWDVNVWDQSLAASSVDVIQILSIEYTPNSIIIEASSRLPQVAKRIEDVNRNLQNAQTVNNPTAPS